MKQKKHYQTIRKITFIFIVLLVSLASVSINYAHWRDSIQAKVTINTGTWGDCIRIKKWIDPTGNPYEYQMDIIVENNGTTYLTDTVVTDFIGKNAKVSSWDVPLNTNLEWSDKELIWTIGDLAPEKSIALSIIITIFCDEGDFIPAVITWPEDTSGEWTHPVKRYTPSQTIVDENLYHVIVIDEINSIKFEESHNEKYPNGIEYLIGDNIYGNAAITTDNYVIRAQGGSFKITTVTKAGTGKATSTLQGIGDWVIDDNGFNLSIEDIIDLDEDEKEYIITLTSDGIGGKNSPELSHIEFNFGKYCPVEINIGATVIAEELTCTLQATTEDITINIDEDGTVSSPQLPYETPWAWDSCDL
jgi:hypothetical protein